MAISSYRTQVCCSKKYMLLILRVCSRASTLQRAPVSAMGHDPEKGPTHLSFRGMYDGHPRVHKSRTKLQTRNQPPNKSGPKSLAPSTMPSAPLRRHAPPNTTSQTFAPSPRDPREHLARAQRFLRANDRSGARHAYRQALERAWNRDLAACFLSHVRLAQLSGDTPRAV